MPEDPTFISVQAKLPAIEDAPAPEPANFFAFQFAGFDIQMLVGYIDPRAVEAFKKSGSAGATVTPLITHRFALSPTGFQILRAQLAEIAQKYDETLPRLRNALGG
jgi:hypothetical protein